MQTGDIMSEIIIYQSADGRTRLGVTLENETLWLNQKQIGELYQKSKSTISEHIGNIFEDEELERGAVVRKCRTTALSLCGSIMLKIILPLKYQTAI